MVTSKLIPLLSVILPTYNAEKWVGKAISSILSQSFTNFELLLVVDLSDDSTYSICKEYAKNDSRITLFYKNERLGVSRASNIGLKHAKGQYVVFCDSDDEYYPNAFESMISSKKKDDELSIFGVEIVKNDKSKLVYSTSCFCTSSSFLDYVIGNNFLSPICFPQWGKLYLKKIINENSLSFDEDVPFGQDAIFTYKYLSCVSKISFYSTIVYKWNNGINHLSLEQSKMLNLELYNQHKMNHLKYENFIPSSVKKKEFDNYALSLYMCLRIMSKIKKNGMKKAVLYSLRDYTINIFPNTSDSMKKRIKPLLRFLFHLKLYRFALFLLVYKPL